MNEHEELNRILDMIERGTVSPEEGERLIASLEANRSTVTCPYCAENIPAGAVLCLECGTKLSRAWKPPRRSGVAGFHALDGWGKFLVLYTFVVCAIVFITPIPFGFSPRAFPQMLLAGLGVVAALLLCKGNRSGWGLILLWSGLQIVRVIVENVVLNQQFLHLGMDYRTNGTGLGFNLVGVILLGIAVKAKNTMKRME